MIVAFFYIYDMRFVNGGLLIVVIDELRLHMHLL